MVETYPSLYFAMAKVTNKQKSHNLLCALNEGLEFWESGKVNDLDETSTGKDKADALISAAALRVLASDRLPKVPKRLKEVVKKEGWILGVNWPKEQ